MKKAISIFLLTTVFSLLSHAQDRSAIITMNNSVLMCPHLSVKFKKIFSSKDYVKGIIVNHETSISSIEISDSKIQETELRSVIVNEIGYPEAEIGSIQFNDREE